MIKSARRATALHTGKRMRDMKTIPKRRMPDSGTAKKRRRENADVMGKMYRPTEEAASSKGKEVVGSDDSSGKGA